jgi:hypothetical protein
MRIATFAALPWTSWTKAEAAWARAGEPTSVAPASWAPTNTTQIQHRAGSRAIAATEQISETSILAPLGVRPDACGLRGGIARRCGREWPDVASRADQSIGANQHTRTHPIELPKHECRLS